MQWRYTQDQMTSFAALGATGQTLLQGTYSYYANGQLKTEQLTDGSTHNYGYDLKGQLTSEYTTGSAPYVTGFVYDSNGNRTRLTISGNSPYATGNVPSTVAQTNTLQSGKNRYASLQTPGGTETALYSDTGELHPAALGSAAQYDSQGRRLLEPTAGRSMEYNHKNERTAVTGANDARQFMYDEASHLIGEYRLDGTVIVEYVWLGDRPVAAIQGNGTVLYLLTDRLNTPRRGYEAVNLYQWWKWDADAFGVNRPSVSAGVEMNLRFAGQVYDRVSGLYYMSEDQQGTALPERKTKGYARSESYYYPRLGRYLEADPIGLEGGNNPYAYAGNDPVNSVDPSGLLYNAFTGTWDIDPLPIYTSNLNISAGFFNQAQLTQATTYAQNLFQRNQIQAFKFKSSPFCAEMCQAAKNEVNFSKPIDFARSIRNLNVFNSTAGERSYLSPSNNYHY